MKKYRLGQLVFVRHGSSGRQVAVVEDLGEGTIWVRKYRRASARFGTRTRVPVADVTALAPREHHGELAKLAKARLGAEKIESKAPTPRPKGKR